ncbi:hypothetical protein OGATHE_004718 [Ogataea polymorpha]|uniref:Uncharacterized protein n=1 Tax=Ogataea polymorpha TaxID=460523 RepID=A0A9P8P0X8_9ASCO|nr:hypothetical protein OGATHE_004718 [Ogataea polymorpha]
MCSAASYIFLVNRDKRVVFFVNIQVFNKPIGEEIIKGPLPIAKAFKMLCGDFRFAVFHDDEWSANSATVSRNMNRGLMDVGEDGNKGRKLASSSQMSEFGNKHAGESGSTNESTVQMHTKSPVAMQGRAIYDRYIFSTQDVTKFLDGVLLIISGDVSHQCQVLDQSTGLSFRSIRGAEHTKLRWLQSTRSRHFSGLFELRRDSCHHTES